MADIVLDTNIFVELLTLYDPKDDNIDFNDSKLFNTISVQFIKQIMEQKGDNGYVVISTFCIIEVINQFDRISANGSKVSKERFLSVINQPPDWLLIENVDFNTAFSLAYVPKRTVSFESMENADSIHVATAITRGNGTYLLATDHKIKELSLNTINII